MGCTASKQSAPHESKRARLYGSNTLPPTERYISHPAPSDLAPKHVTFASSTKDDKRGSANDATRGSDEVARPKETFEAYARRGVIREYALLPEGIESRRTENLKHKKRVGGFEKYTQE